MSVIELLIVSIGLSIDVFVAAVYMGAGFSKINKKNLFGLCNASGHGDKCGCILCRNGARFFRYSDD